MQIYYIINDTINKGKMKIKTLLTTIYVHKTLHVSYMENAAKHIKSIQKSLGPIF